MPCTPYEVALTLHEEYILKPGPQGYTNRLYNYQLSRQKTICYTVYDTNFLCAEMLSECHYFLRLPPFLKPLSRFSFQGTGLDTQLLCAFLVVTIFFNIKLLSLWRRRCHMGPSLHIRRSIKQCSPLLESCILENFDQRQTYLSSETGCTVVIKPATQLFSPNRWKL